MVKANRLTSERRLNATQLKHDAVIWAYFRIGVATAPSVYRKSENELCESFRWDSNRAAISPIWLFSQVLTRVGGCADLPTTTSALGITPAKSTKWECPRQNRSMPSSRRSTKRPYQAEHRELNMNVATGGRRVLERRGEDWTVQNIRTAEKTYICPGCNHDIVPGTSHVVAWANDSLFGKDAALAARRHWHSRCWNIQE